LIAGKRPSSEWGHERARAATSKRRHKAGKDYRTVDLGNGVETASPEAV
jgi:hypothetical protein